MRLFSALFMINVCALAGLAAAQQPAPSPAPRFNYFWVKASPPDQIARYCTNQEGQVQCTNTTLQNLIALSYGVTPDKVIGGPAWLAHNLYDLRARAAAGTTPLQMQAMLQMALAEHFGLRVQLAQRPEPAYALTLAHGAPKLAAAAAPAQAPECKYVPPPRPAAGSPPTRRALVVDCTSVSMADLVIALPDTPARMDVNRPLVDHTGLSGKYDFELRFLPRTALRRPGDEAYDPDVDISLFGALEKLGLKLEPAESSASVVMVDAVNSTVLADAAHPLSPPLATEFIVAEMKPVENPTRQMRMVRVTPGGEVDMCCFSLEFFITDAWNFSPQRLANAPDWLAKDLWSLRAKADPGTLMGDVDPMLQNFLDSHFGLVMHDGTQTMPVYALRVADRTKLTPNTVGGVSNCTVARDDDGVNFAEACTDVTMPEFAENLNSKMMPSYFGDRPVVDMTGLSGAWDFKLKCATAMLTGIAPAGFTPPTGITLPPANPLAISCYDALKQTGLKIGPDKQPVAVKIIDHVNRIPSGN